jgi:hypothetical protein
MSGSGEHTPTLKAAIAHLWSMQTQVMLENLDGLTPYELWDRTPQHIKAMRLDAMRAALAAASPSPRSGGGEPVAWRWRQLHHEIDGPITGWTYGPAAPDFSERHRWEVQPLYASPTSGEIGMGVAAGWLVASWKAKAAVLRSRGQNNSLHDIQQAADYLEQAADALQAALSASPTREG